MEKKIETGLAVFIALFFLAVFFLPQTSILDDLENIGSRTEVEKSELVEFDLNEFGLTFRYPGDQNGYIIDSEIPIGSEEILLFMTPSTGRQLILRNSESLILVRIYTNIGDRINDWAPTIPELKYDEKINGRQYGRIQGRDALWFQTRENIGTDNLIIRNNDVMIVFTAIYPLFNQSIRNDLITIIENIEF